MRQERVRKKATDFLAVPSMCLNELTRKHGYAHVAHIPNMVDIGIEDEDLTGNKDQARMAGGADINPILKSEFLAHLDNEMEQKETSHLSNAKSESVVTMMSDSISRIERVELLGVNSEQKNSTKSTGTIGSIEDVLRSLSEMTVRSASLEVMGKYIVLEEYKAPAKSFTEQLIRGLRAEVGEDWKTRMVGSMPNGRNAMSFQPGKKRLLYYCGAIRSSKGVFWLLENYRQRDYKNLELHLVGPLQLDDKRKTPRWRKEFNGNLKNTESETVIFYRLLKESGAIYDGEVTRKELIKKLRGAFAVIIPSISFENYPNVGLEAIGCNCLVCGADNGGIKELVSSPKLLLRRDSQ